MQRLVIIHVNPRRLCYKWELRVEDENACVTVNWIRAALKVTASYIPAATVCFINNLIINLTTKDKFEITLCSWLKEFVALIRNKGSLILTAKTIPVLFYIRLFNFSSRLLTE